MANPANLTGSFVPTSFIFDIAQLQQLDVTSPEFKELLVKLYQNINLMCIVLNAKTGGYYSINPFVVGDLYFPDATPTGIGASLSQNSYRPSTRVTINFGALPNAATKSVAHGIPVSANTTWVKIYGTATDPVGKTGIPLPYASSVAAKIVELNVDATNVNVTTAGNLTNYTTTIIVLEYLNF